MSSASKGSANTSRRQCHRFNRRARGTFGAAVALLLALSLMGCAAGTAVLPPGLPPVAGGFFTILTLTVVDGIVGRPYVNPLRTRGATAPMSSCAISSGSLPTGIQVRTGTVATPADTTDDDTCVLIGIPTATGSFVFEVEMRDSSFAIQRATQGYNLRIRPEFEIATFEIVDGIASRDYDNTFTVTTNAATVAGTEDPEDVNAAEAGNGPLTACTLDGLPASVGFTCDVNGNAVDITLTNTGALPAGGPGVITIFIQDNPILQDGVEVVPVVTVSNQTNNTPFDLSFTVRNEFSITSAPPVLLPDGTEGGPYDEQFTITTNLSNNANEVAQSAELGNGPITDCVVTNLIATLDQEVVGTPGTSCTVRVFGTITAVEGDYTLSVEVTDSDITQTGVVVLANAISSLNLVALSVTGPLRWTLETVDATTTTSCTGSTYNPHATADAPDAVIGRTYGDPRCDLLFRALGGVAPMAWNFSAPGMPDLVCTEEDVAVAGDNRRLRCNTDGNLVDVAATTDDLTVDVTDQNGTNVDAEDVTGHTVHQILVHDALTFALDVAVDPPPPGVQGRNYGNTSANNCGVSGTDACLALVYTAAGGLTPYSFAPLPGVSATPVVAPPGATPAAVSCSAVATTVTCTTGTDSGDNITAAANNPIPESYPYTVTVTDAASNDTTPGNISIPIADSIDVFSGLVVALVSPSDPPPVAVNGRTYGTDVASCVGGADCLPLLYRAAGGLGDPTVDGSYVFTFGTGATTTGSLDFPADIDCTTGTNPDADELTCATVSGIAVTTTGTYTPRVDVDDFGNATTPGGTAAPGPKNLVVNDALSFSVDAVTSVGTVTGGGDSPANGSVGFPPSGVIGRSYMDAFGFELTFGVATNGLLFQPAGGLGGHTWSAITGSVPPDVVVVTDFFTLGDLYLACFHFDFGLFAFVCDPQPGTGSFNYSFTVSDTANASTPSGPTDTDNLGHSTHTSVINAALNIASVTPLDSAKTATAYSNTLTGTGGIGAFTWSTVGGASFTDDADCGTGGTILTLNTGTGAITGTPTGAAGSACNFTAILADAGNALTPSSGDAQVTDSAPLSIPISGGTLAIQNDVLINGLAGFPYIQTFKENLAGDCAGNLCSWVSPNSAADPPCPTPGGSDPDPTGIASAADIGTLDDTPAAGTYTFGICVTDDANTDFALKNFTMRVNEAFVGVTNSGDDTITGIDTATDTPQTPLTVSGDPRAIDVTRDGNTAVVAHSTSGDLVVFDTLEGDNIKSTFSIGSNSVGVAVSFDGAFAYVTDVTDNVVRKIDLSDGSVDATIAVGAGPRGIAINFNAVDAAVAALDAAAGELAVVANSGDDTISFIDLTTDSEIDTVPGGGITRISVGDGPHGVAFDPASNRVFVTNFGGDSYSVYDLVAGGTATEIDISPATSPQGLVVTPDGQHLYIATEGGTVEVYNIVPNTDDATLDPNTFVASVDFTGGGSVLEGIDTTVDRKKTYASDFFNDEVVIVDTDPTSGGFNAVHGNSPVPVGIEPVSEESVRTIPYPVLHFTLAVDGGTGRRILAQADGGTGVPAYIDFIRVLGGVPPYTFVEDPNNLNLDQGGNNCADFNTVVAATGAIVNDANIDFGGTGTFNCDFTIIVTDSATPPQAIQGDFRIVITDE